jgi:hypothetical protein
VSDVFFDEDFLSSEAFFSLSLVVPLDDDGFLAFLGVLPLGKKFSKPFGTLTCFHSQSSENDDEVCVEVVGLCVSKRYRFDTKKGAGFTLLLFNITARRAAGRNRALDMVNSDEISKKKEQ